MLQVSSTDVDMVVGQVQDAGCYRRRQKVAKAARTYEKDALHAWAGRRSGRGQ